MLTCQRRIWCVPKTWKSWRRDGRNLCSNLSMDLRDAGCSIAGSLGVHAYDVW